MGQECSSSIFGPLSCVKRFGAFIHRYLDVHRMDRFMRGIDMRWMVNQTKYRVLGFDSPIGVSRFGHPWESDMGNR